MARFLCSIHAPKAVPRAYAIVEVGGTASSPTYTVRDLRSVDVPDGAEGDDPFRMVFDAVNAEPQHVAQTTFVTTGGQRAADAIHEHGPSAVAVTVLGGRSGDADAHGVSLQMLVDTFERLYRDGAVTVPGSLDAASAAVDALYRESDLEAAAADSDRDAEGNIDDAGSGTLAGSAVPGDGPKAVVTEQSGSAAPDLGDAEATAIALALACWYGEASRDSLPQTDKADEALANRRKQSGRKG